MIDSVWQPLRLPYTINYSWRLRLTIGLNRQWPKRKSKPSLTISYRISSRYGVRVGCVACSALFIGACMTPLTHNPLLSVWASWKEAGWFVCDCTTSLRDCQYIRQLLPSLMTWPWKNRGTIVNWYCLSLFYFMFWSIPFVFYVIWHQFFLEFPELSSDFK